MRTTPATEVELWAALREPHATAIGAISRLRARAACRVVELVEGEVAAVRLRREPTRAGSPRRPGAG